MLQFGGTGPKCSKCVDHWGFGFFCIIFIGLTIGWVGLRFVETPPSVMLLAQTRIHSEQTTEIIQRLDTVEKLLLELKSDVSKIKKEITETN
jgi:hypothetical protein